LLNGGQYKDGPTNRPARRLDQIDQPEADIY